MPELPHPRISRTIILGAVAGITFYFAGLAALIFAVAHLLLA